MTLSVDLYWSFRSPYSYLATPRLRAMAQTCGITLPRVRFRPHVTLARFGQRLQPGQLQQIHQLLQHFGGFTSPVFTVQQITLYRSTLLPEGARYEALAQYPLRAETA